MRIFLFLLLDSASFSCCWLWQHYRLSFFSPPSLWHTLSLYLSNDPAHLFSSHPYTILYMYLLFSPARHSFISIGIFIVRLISHEPSKSISIRNFFWLSAAIYWSGITAASSAPGSAIELSHLKEFWTQMRCDLCWLLQRFSSSTQYPLHDRHIIFRSNHGCDAVRTQRWIRINLIAANEDWPKTF